MNRIYCILDRAIRAIVFQNQETEGTKSNEAARRHEEILLSSCG